MLPSSQNRIAELKVQGWNFLLRNFCALHPAFRIFNFRLHPLSLILIFLFLLPAIVGAQSGPTFLYDELNRLRAVVDSAETVIYEYDPVGNLLRITRQPSSQVSIIEFSPKQGPVATAVVIYGTAMTI